MGRFAYEALDRAGTSARGEIEATSRELAVAQLVASGLTPIEVQATRTQANLLSGLRRRLVAAISPTDTAAFTRELGAMIRAGMTVDRALAVAGDLAPTPAQRHLIGQLLARVRSGASLSDALEEQGEVFSRVYVGMVRAGEYGGSLADTLNQLAGMLERALESRRRLTSALIYPAILTAMMVVTVLIVVGVVLPRLESLFTEAQASLPLATRIVLAFGHFLQSYGWLLMLAAVIGTGVLISALRQPHNRRRLHATLLRTRRLGEWIGLFEFGRFARVLGTLLAGGVPLPFAIKLAVASVHNLALAETMAQALGKVREGSSLGDLLAGLKHAPTVLVSLVRVGEQTGQLDRMLLESASLLESRMQALTERYLALLVPALTIVMGLLVAGVLGSVLVGILSVNDLAL